MPPFRTIDTQAILSVIAAGYEVNLDPIIELPPVVEEVLPPVVPVRSTVPFTGPNVATNFGFSPTGVPLDQVEQGPVIFSKYKLPFLGLVDSHIRERIRLSVETTEYPVEEGFIIADHSIVRPEIIEIFGFSGFACGNASTSDTPQTPDRSYVGLRQLDAWQELEKVFYAREPIDIYTRLGIRKSFVIIELETDLDVSTGPSLPFRMTLKKINRQFVSFDNITGFDVNDYPVPEAESLRPTSPTNYSDYPISQLTIDYDRADQYAQKEIATYAVIQLKDTYEDAIDDGLLRFLPGNQLLELRENYNENAAGRRDIFEIPLQDKQEFRNIRTPQNPLNLLKAVRVDFQIPGDEFERIEATGGARTTPGRRLRLTITSDSAEDGGGLRYQIEDTLLREVVSPGDFNALTGQGQVDRRDVVTASQSRAYPPTDVLPHYIAHGVLTVGQPLVGDSRRLLGEFVVLANKESPVEFLSSNRVWDDYDFLFLPASELRNIQSSVYRNFASAFTEEAHADASSTGYIE